MPVHALSGLMNMGVHNTFIKDTVDPDVEYLLMFEGNKSQLNTPSLLNRSEGNDAGSHTPWWRRSNYITACSECNLTANLGI